MTIKLISFDVWSTLVKANSAYKTRRSELIARLAGITDVAAAHSAMNEADDFLDDFTLQTGQQFGYSERLERTLMLLGAPTPSPDQLSRLAEEMTVSFLQYPPTLTETNTPSMLEKLRKMQLLIAVNSNTGFVSGKLMRQMFSVVGLDTYVDFWLFSDEIGFAKPSLQVYTHLQRVADVSAGEILHVGDNLEADYKGARAAGLNALWYAPSADSASYVLQKLGDLPQHRLLTP